jgi:tRNA threonylcarbamoyladenosine biosynthesis protein TsaE
MGPLVFDEKLSSHSVAETESLAAEFYRIIGHTALVALYGPLGAGKTCFVRGLARAAGVDPDEVTSPSFTLINEYPGGETPIFHFDLYRMVDPSEFYSIGGDDYLARDGLVLIEWAENGAGFIPAIKYTVTFEIIDETTRRLIFTRSGL